MFKNKAVSCISLLLLAHHDGKQIAQDQNRKYVILISIIENFKKNNNH